MKYVYLAFAFCILSLTGFSQQVNWSLGVGGTNSEYVQAVETDPNGNTFITGQFRSLMDMDPSAGESFIEPLGQFDGYLSKFDPSGNLLWTKTFPGADFTTPYDMTISDEGEVFITGSFSGEVNFNPGGLELLDSGEGSDAFVLRLDNDGNFQNVFSIQGEGQTSGSAIELGQDGYIYVAGGLSTDSCDFDPGVGEAFITNSPGGLFLAKYSPLGTYQWAWGISGTGGTGVSDMAIAQDGTVALTGLFQQTVDFNPGEGVIEYESDGIDSYLLGLNPDGTYKWIEVFTGNNSEVTFAVDFNSAGDVYVGGYFVSEIDLDPSLQDEYMAFSPNNANAFAVKLKNNFGYPIYETSNVILSQGDGKFIDIIVDPVTERVNMVGLFNGTITLPNNATIFSNGGKDILAINYNLNFVYDNYLIFGGSSDDHINTGCSSVHANGITIGGSYYNTFDFGPGPEVLEGPMAQGDQDIFLASYSSLVSVPEVEVEQVKFYPNPTTDKLQALTDKNWNAYIIYDFMGRAISSGANNQKNTIDMSGLSTGAYVIRLLDGNENRYQGVAVKGG